MVIVEPLTNGPFSTLPNTLYVLGSKSFPMPLSSLQDESENAIAANK
jgi:hypothetical protein